MKKFCLIFLIIIFSINLSFSQENQDKHIVSETGGAACETNSALFDAISNEANQNKERVFVIFRAGNDETEIVNSNRLIYVKWFLKNYKGWDVINKVFARGEKADGNGKIEFYIGGKISFIVISPKNKTPCLDCCEDVLYHQQNLLKQKRSKKRKQ